MKTSRFLAYASTVILIAGGAIWYIINDYNANKQTSAPTATVDVVMYKNEGCKCCDKWASYMQGNGYAVSTVTDQNVYEIKSQRGIPQQMAACHTAIVGNYVVEGHVPVEDINRLLEEQPKAAGLVVPGMPASSPGMNTALNKPYKVYLLKSDGSTEVYAQH